jgi:hypothetical protein
MDEIPIPDPAAVFACAKSLHDACLERENAESDLNLSESYQGIDSFMREVMRVSAMFEDWACRHVVFNELEEVWPYFLEARFGAAYLEMMKANMLTSFDADDCLRIAFRLRLPILVDGSLMVPLCIEAPHPLAGTAFHRLRIQTMWQELDEEGGMIPFIEEDDPFDENFATPLYRIYGVGADGLLEHISDCKTYASARRLLAMLLPGINFPEQITAFTHKLTVGVDSRNP